MRCPHCNREFLSKQAQIRSTPENKYYWGVVVKILSDELGCTSNEVHEVLKELFLKTPKYLKTKEGLREIWVTKSTASLTIGDFEEYLEKIRQWASIEMGYWIPEPWEESNAG